MSEADNLELRANNILTEMYELKAFCEMEIEFKEIAEKNDKMRELWSEYALLKGYSSDRGLSKLPSREEYFNRRKRLSTGCGVTKEWSEPLFVCPSCGGNVRRNEGYIMTSFPPQFIYKCEDCGHQDIHE